MLLPGTPSDQVGEVLAEGDGDITTMFVSMARRHPDGADADYLRWHTLDHRPEQHRLSAVRASLRLVSTPRCRAARTVSRPPYDAIDHVMTYFFTGIEGMGPFLALSKALGDAGRKLPLLPPVERGVYDVSARAAAPRIKVGAHVLPWWPARGVYLLLENGTAAVEELLDVDGVAGAWTATSLPVSERLASAPAGQTLTYCFLDDDPVGVGERIAPALDARWGADGVDPLLAAPFHPVIPYEWERHVP
ncbi:hypothetical protein CRI77_12445 [Mycolicibacterium duvalii]|uniref:Uncharacterized protein n=1 Tax=Mycolicibacterium duvalii TaxID=39688 RepID=A0A7I7JX00_9MYCO|nr:hypothetical protein [Mycolicibacterium duvalii]MCV7370007.1 hypothetical protein [Mycolicibacterium duvalii]PEG40752.1 hypothetical protein CRI77_12445 [Mycolicibacterium duvalii]BBX15612.1 hypothetical protein MDUV_04720 [Mycolicibacterium duvalii]